MTDNDLTYLSVGSDRYRAHLIAEACRAEGIRVELLTSDAGGADPALSYLQDHRLLVYTGDLDRVRAIVARS